MSSEVSKQNNSLGSALATYGTFPAINVGGSALLSIKANGGIRKALKAQNKEGFKKLNEALKGQTDVFTRSQVLSESYNQYKTVSRSSARAEKQLARVNKGKNVSLSQKLANVFKTKDEKVTKSTVKSIASKRTGKLNAIDEAIDAKKYTELDNLLDLENGRMTFANATKAANVAEAGLKSGVKNFGKTTLGNFKHELGFKNGKFNYIMTALQFVPNIFQKVIPAFKNNGFKAGMTELGQTIVQAGADLVSYAAGGAIGRTIGTAIGTIICPGVGSAIGGTVGDMVGSMFVGTKVCDAVEKITNKDDAANTGDMSLAQEDTIAQEAQAQMIAQAQATQSETPQTAQKLDINSDDAQLNTYENLPSAEEIRQTAKKAVYAKHGFTPKANYLA